MNSTRGEGDLLRTRLVLNDAFRALALAALNDKTETGTIVLREGGSYEEKSPHGSQGGTITPDAFAPKVGVTVSFRVCDDVAHRLKRIEGLPRLELYWPEAKRDEAVAAVREFLGKNGNNLELGPATWPWSDD